MVSFLRLQLCPCCACPVYWLPGFLYARGQPCWLHTYTVLLWLGSPHQCLIESRCFFQRPDTPQHDRVDPIGKTHSPRSEEHTSELQSRGQLVCRLLLQTTTHTHL